MSLGNTQQINVLYSNFINSCDEYCKYVINAHDLYIKRVENDGIVFDKTMRNLIVEYSFMKFFLNWEFFLEQSFISFSLGLEGLNGNKLTSYVSPRDYTHAYSIIQGNSHYPDWTSAEKVLKLANDFFENGGTFNELTSIRTLLQEIKTIRNSLSHMSVNSKTKFESLVRNHHGHYPFGFEPADFLLMIVANNPSGPISFFEHYALSLKSLSTIIVSPS